MQDLPYIVFGLASLSVLGTYSIPKLWKNRRKYLKLPDSSYRPLLAHNTSSDDADETDNLLTSETGADSEVLYEERSYGSIFNHPSAAADSVSDSTLGSTQDKVIIASVVRSTSERIRVSLEAITVTAQVFLSLLALWVPEISEEWQGELLNTPAIFLAYWSYALIIICIRLYFIVKSKTPSGGLWYHSTYLYTIAWAFSLSQLYSAALHPVSIPSRNFNIAAFLLSTTLFILNYTAKIGDKPGRLYLAPSNVPPSVEPISSLFGLLTYSWIDPLIWKGYWQYLDIKDIWELREDDHAYQVLEAFRTVKKTSGLAWRMSVFFKKEIFIATIWAIVYSFTNFGPAMMLKKILEYVEDPDSVSPHVAWLYVFAILFFGVFDSTCNGQALYIGRRICIRMRAIIIGEVYSKGLRRQVAPGSDATLLKKDEEEEETDNFKKKKTSSDEESKPEESDSESANIGTIINLMAVDAMKVSEICAYLHYFASSVLIIIFAIAFLCAVISWSALVGALAMVLIMPLNYWFADTYGKIQAEMMAITDERIEKTNELLQSIRIIKYFAWEEKFAEGVNEIRRRELRVLRNRYLLWVTGGAIWYISPLLIAVFSFGSYTLIQKRELTTPVAFTALALFNILRFPMDQLAEMISEVVQSKVSVDRVDAFLAEPETKKYEVLRNQTRGPNSPYIGFEQATFSWNDGADSKNNKNNKNSVDAPVANDFKLRDLDVKFDVGKLNVIVGPTGSGKTSLLLALLGEMKLDSGRVFLPCPGPRETLKIDPATGFTDSVAYCSQQAWLLNDTLRNNILFAAEYDEERYNAVIEACALSRDLDILEYGDSTEIGEKGITLSGGQKQRISLARAIYSKARHLILDDCLSAVDSHTALHIYEKCLTAEICDNRTIILVSHNVALTIKKASNVIVLENGRVKVQGHPSIVGESGALGDDDLVRQSASESATQPASRAVSEVNLLRNAVGNKSIGKDLVKSLEQAKKEAAKNEDLGPTIEEELGDPAPTSKDKLAGGKLVKEEEHATGDVKLEVYVGYAKMLGTPAVLVVVLFFFAIHPASGILQTWWIREWTANLTDNVSVLFVHTSDYAEKASRIPLLGPILDGFHRYTVFAESIVSVHHGPAYYLIIYTLLGLLYMLLGCVREAMLCFCGLRASRIIFERLLQSVLKAKIRFFDSTPIGRIMNRFSKDIEGVDQDLIGCLMGMMTCLISAGLTTMLIVFVTPKFLVAGVFMVAVYWAIGSFYLASSRELKRLDAVSKSPIYQQFGETLVGVATIRAYGDENRFIQDNLAKIDVHNRPFFYLWVANRWLSLRIDFAGAFMSFFAASFVILSTGKVDAGWAGLSLSYALTFNENMLWLVRLYAVVEMNMNSVERLLEYMRIDPEAPSAKEADEHLPSNWPNNGEIEVKDLSLRYAPELPQVIKNVSFKVEKFNKIGIVGRTGAGKSTIITALFRFLEPDTGKIVIDGIDISTLGLDKLRQALAIIPQDPTLFTGTIRSNLDPFDNYSDDQIFEALKRVHLVQTDEILAASSSASVESGENANQFLNLSSKVTEGGNNLSQGQRQLMCLARSLLKTPKVLLLDEATASIDYETDAKIQNTIREEFAETTILTIAHRLRSIIDYDKILVMDAGKAIEYLHPHELLSNKDSVFYDMCSKSGELDALETLAKQAWAKHSK